MPEYMLCRICLTEDTNSDSMTPLFDEHDAQCQEQELVRKIEQVGGIKLLPLEDIPSMLCHNCLETLTSAYKFRELCQESERTFASNVVKAEMKSEPGDDNSQMESHDVEFIYEAANEFIDADEDVEGMMEERLEDYVEEDNIQDEEFATEEVSAEDVFLGHTSDSDYDPSDRVRVRKPKARKTRLGKRGRPRNASHPSQMKQQRNEAASNSKRSSGKSTEEAPTNIMCEICGNIYSKRSALNIHMRRHMAEKPFECEICGKTFAGPSELNRHIRVHTGEKPFTCKYCSRSFADRSSNIRHERTHTNERPFSCLTCGKCFSYSNVLKNHMLTHTGEKPFICLPCNKTFSRKHQLEQHLGTLTHQQTVRSRQAAEGNMRAAIYTA